MACDGRLVRGDWSLPDFWWWCLNRRDRNALDIFLALWRSFGYREVVPSQWAGLYALTGGAGLTAREVWWLGVWGVVNAADDEAALSLSDEAWAVRGGTFSSAYDLAEWLADVPLPPECGCLTMWFHLPVKPQF